MITDPLTGKRMFGNMVSKTAAHASADAAYTAWAAELGVSPTSTISAFNGDDDMFFLDLGFAPVLGSSETQVLMSNESGLGFYVYPKSNLTRHVGSQTSGTASVSRMALPFSPPAALFTARAEPADSKIEGSKWQKATNAAIIYYKTGPLGPAATTQVAYKIKPGSVEVYISNAAAGTKLQYFGFKGTQTTTPTAITGYAIATVSGVLNYVSDAMKTISGNVKDDSGANTQRTVRIYDRLNGELVASALSDATTGNYSTVALVEGEVNIVCLDDSAGNLLNDLMIRTTPA